MARQDIEDNERPASTSSDTNLLPDDSVIREGLRQSTNDNSEGDSDVREAR